MAISLEELADALRVDNVEDKAVADALGHWLRAARELVHVRAPTAPIAIADAAVLKAAGYWYDQPTTSRRASFANAMTNSGALHLLGPWIVRRAAGAAALDALIGGAIANPSRDHLRHCFGLATWPGLWLGIPNPSYKPR